MSHQVVINYEAISIECRSICEVAVKQLCQIDSLLQKIDETSKSLQGSETEGMKRALRERADTIKGKIKEIVEQSEIVGKRGVVRTDSVFLHGDGRDIVRVARELSREVNQVTTGDIAKYQALLDSLLKKKIADHNRNLELRASGTVAYNEEFSLALAEITDEALKGFIYLEWLDNRNIGKNFAELKNIAESKMKDEAENYFRSEHRRIVKEIESEMRDAKLDEETINTVLKSESSELKEQISEIRDKATDEMVREAVRKKTLKIVMDCIESKDFIVDRKNIKLQKEQNQVVMIAQKASGERAEFRVMLDGKFIYRFDGYEGQACQNDIQPFMSDLEEIYGIKVIDSKEIWKNPDKISTQKYQEIKVKSNKE
jgi:uncharacterized protein YbjQ (UPF0145 family)